MRFYPAQSPASAAALIDSDPRLQVCLTEVGRLVVVSKYGAAMPPHADEVILRGA